MPRRNDDSVRVGLNSIVRARISSKSGKLSGPLMNAVMVDAFSRFTPGVMSTSTTDRTSSGCAVGQRDRGDAAERHADDRLGVRRERCDGRRDVARVVLRPPVIRCGRRPSGRGREGRSPRAGGPARARRCPTCARSARRRGGTRARVVASPHTSALRLPSALDLDLLAADRGRTVVRDAELLGVLVEQRELVVRDAFDVCHAAHPTFHGMRDDEAAVEEARRSPAARSTRRPRPASPTSSARSSTPASRGSSFPKGRAASGCRRACKRS